jgi:hypothetical protein
VTLGNMRANGVRTLAARQATIKSTCRLDVPA